MVNVFYDECPSRSHRQVVNKLATLNFNPFHAPEKHTVQYTKSAPCLQWFSYWEKVEYAWYPCRSQTATRVVLITLNSKTETLACVWMGNEQGRPIKAKAAGYMKWGTTMWRYGHTNAHRRHEWHENDALVTVQYQKAKRLRDPRMLTRRLTTANKMYRHSAHSQCNDGPSRQARHIP